MAEEKENSKLDDLIKRLPFFNGAGRRRLVSGALLLLVLGTSQHKSVSAILEQIDLEKILTSPGLLLLGGLVVYAVGSLIEILSEFFFSRAAAGFLATFFPTYISKTIEEEINPVTRFEFLRGTLSILLFLTLPFIALVNMVRGVAQGSMFVLDAQELVNREGNDYFNALPDAVKDGLIKPLSSNSEFAYRYLISRLGSEDDKRWAHSFLVRSKDVAALTTTIVLALITVTLAEFGGAIASAAQPTEIRVPVLMPDDKKLIAEQLSKVQTAFGDIPAPGWLDFKIQCAEPNRLDALSECKEVARGLARYTPRSTQTSTDLRRPPLKNPAPEAAQQLAAAYTNASEGYGRRTQEAKEQREKLQQEARSGKIWLILILSTFYVALFLLYLGLLKSLQQTFVCILEFAAVSDTSPPSIS